MWKILYQVKIYYFALARRNIITVSTMIIGFRVLSEPVLVSHLGITYEVGKEGNSAVLSSSIAAHILQPAAGLIIKALEFEDNHLAQTDGEFHPPKSGWGDVVYTVVTGTVRHA